MCSLGSHSIASHLHFVVRALKLLCCECHGANGCTILLVKQTDGIAAGLCDDLRKLHFSRVTNIVLQKNES
eukprot:SAG11_NODE_27_length_23309_cov_10.579362_9_plen_71_part_00